MAAPSLKKQAMATPAFLFFKQAMAAPNLH